MDTQTFNTVEVVHPRLGVIKVNEHEVSNWIAQGCSPYGGEPVPTPQPASTDPAPEVIKDASVDATPTTQESLETTETVVANTKQVTPAPNSAKGTATK